MRFAGGLIYSVRAVIKPATFLIFKNIIISDHASKVVHNSLKRYFGESIENNFIKLSPSRLNVLISFWKNIRIMYKAYKDAKISHFTEYARIFKIFYFYLSCDAYLKDGKINAVMFARTNDQKRLALAAAAEKSNIPIIVYTVDRVATRKPAPFKIDIQFCWTEDQKDFCRKQKIESVLMPVPYIQKMKTTVPCAKNAVCGFLLNAKCNLEEVEDYLNMLKENYGLTNIHIRPHPGFDEKKLYILNKFKISDWRESLNEYLDKMDMVFALNTNAMIEALLQGVPIVYIGGLDAYEEDLQGFVAEGIVLQFKEEFKFPESINNFYNADKFKRNWNPNCFTIDGNSENDVLEKIFKK